MSLMSRLWEWVRPSIVQPDPGEAGPVRLPYFPAARFSVCYADGADLTPGEERLLGQAVQLLYAVHLEDAYDWCAANETEVEFTYGPGVLGVIDLARSGRVMMVWAHGMERLAS